MALTPGEADRLLLHLQASLAGQRRERGLRLNVPEARALIADAVCEWARDGLSWVQARDQARHLLTSADVIPGVVEALEEVRVEARFDDGTRLVVVPDPFGARTPEPAPMPEEGNPKGWLDVTNESPTDIGLSSHVHLAEVNPRLRLDRSAAFGMRAALGAGSTLWITAGDTRRVPITPIAGSRIAFGTTGLIDGHLDDPQVRDEALLRLRACGYLDIVDGQPLGTAIEAEGAVSRVMELRHGQ